MVFPASTHSYSEASEEASVPTSNIRQCFNLRGAAGNSRSTANAARGGNLTSDPSSRSAAGRGTVNSSAGRAAQAVAARGTVDDHDQARNTADNAVTTNPDCAVCHEPLNNTANHVARARTYATTATTIAGSTASVRGAPVLDHDGTTTNNEFQAISTTVRQRERGIQQSCADQLSPRRRRVGPGRGANFTHDETTTLLDLVEQKLPVYITDWEQIAAVLYNMFPKEARTGDGCRRKFLGLCNRRYFFFFDCLIIFVTFH